MSQSHEPYIDEVATHRKRYLKIVHFTQSSTRAAGVMLLAAIVALAVANNPAVSSLHRILAYRDNVWHRWEHPFDVVGAHNQ